MYGSLNWNGKWFLDKAFSGFLVRSFSPFLNTVYDASPIGGIYLREKTAHGSMVFVKLIPLYPGQKVRTEAANHYHQKVISRGLVPYPAS